MNWQEQKAELKEAFDRDGFVEVPGFFGPDELDDVRQQLDRYVRDTLPTLPQGSAFYEDTARPDTITRLGQMHEHAPYFEAMYTQGACKELAETLLGEPVRGINMQYFNKPPAIGQPTPPHQDGYYFMLDPCEALTIWLALEDVDESTGCVRYVRGSHKRGMRPHTKTKVLGFSQGMTDFGTPEDIEDEVACPVRAGTALVHHAMTIHRADGNGSPLRTRQALGSVYRIERAKRDEQKVKEYRRKLYEEWETEGKL